MICEKIRFLVRGTNYSLIEFPEKHNNICIEKIINEKSAF
jgi:hypothetical protein